MVFGVQGQESYRTTVRNMFTNMKEFSTRSVSAITAGADLVRVMQQCRRCHSLCMFCLYHTNLPEAGGLYYSRIIAAAADPTAATG